MVGNDVLCGDCVGNRRFATIRQDKGGNRDYSVCWVCGDKKSQNKGRDGEGNTCLKDNKGCLTDKIKANYEKEGLQYHEINGFEEFLRDCPYEWELVSVKFGEITLKFKRLEDE